MRTIFSGNRHGFTLIEVIVSIVLAAILGTMLTQFIGANLSRSAQAVGNTQTGLEVKAVMEQITNDYRLWLESDAKTPGASLYGTFKTKAESYSSGGISVSTSTAGFEIDPGNDGGLEIMQVTVSAAPVSDPAKTQILQSIFTHVP